MKNNIPKILLKIYLRRQPVHLRLPRFNFLMRYGWMKNSLEDLRSEFFPDTEKKGGSEVIKSPREPSLEAQKLIHAHLQGKRGVYEVTHWVRGRGNGEGKRKKGKDKG